jgi:hypothetical protein
LLLSQSQNLFVSLLTFENDFLLMRILALETKAHNAKSDEYGDWGITVIPCFAKNWKIRSEP